MKGVFTLGGARYFAYSSPSSVTPFASLCFAVVSHECTQNPSFFVYTKTLLDLQCRKPNTKAVRVGLSHQSHLLDQCATQQDGTLMLNMIQMPSRDPKFMQRSQRRYIVCRTPPVAHA